MTNDVRRVGRYDILDVVGSGATAVVYRANQRDLDRIVALKQLTALTSTAREGVDPAKRFLREARLAAKLAHPNVVHVYEYLEQAGNAYIAMEYLDFGPLRPRVGQLSPAQVVQVMRATLLGLAHAEQHRIVHRDLKPENLLITADGGIKITDFGIAKALDVLAEASAATRSDSTLGTPLYMAPEQAQGQQVGPWTDLYALGVIAYELLAGQVPFGAEGGSTPASILVSHVVDPIPPLEGVRPGVDPDLATWVEGLLAKRPEDRPQSADAARAQLERSVGDMLSPGWEHRPAVPLTPVGPRSVESERPEPRRQRSSRRARRLTAVVVALAALAAPIAGFTLGDHDSEAATTVDSPDLSVAYETGWAPAKPSPALARRIPLRNAVDLRHGRGATLAAGLLEGARPGANPLPAITMGAWRAPPKPKRVRLGSLPALQFGGRARDGTFLTVSTVPSSNGWIALACRRSRRPDPCEPVIASLRLNDARALGLAPSARFATVLRRSLDQVAAGERRWGSRLRARSPRKRANAADHLARAARRAQRTLVASEPGLQERASTTVLEAALRRLGGACSALARADRRGDHDAYRRARARLLAADEDVSRALAALGTLGYESAR